MTGRYKLNEAQAGIIATLLNRRDKIDAQLSELVGMLCNQYGVDKDWLVKGTPDGFVLVPPEEMRPNETDS